jgi:hypothetical protein
VQNPAFLPKLLRKSWQMSNKRLVQWSLLPTKLLQFTTQCK